VLGHCTMRARGKRGRGPEGGGDGHGGALLRPPVFSCPAAAPLRRYRETTCGLWASFACGQLLAAQRGTEDSGRTHRRHFGLALFYVIITLFDQK
jgi:hypothetical protein